jgi:aspartate beta-hydroxylase
MSDLLEQARMWVQSDDARAEGAYRQVLEHGESVEARVFLAHLALSRGAADDALTQLQQACRSEPGNAQLLRQLAVAAEAAGYPDEARKALQFAVQLSPSLYLAHLQLGRLLEGSGDRHGAARSYFRALTRAQLKEQCLDEASTPPRLRAQVAQASAFVQATRPEILNGLLEPLIAMHGREAMRRVERCLSGYLGQETVLPADPRQRPRFLFFPDLPSTPFLRRQDFDWIERLEDDCADIRVEARAVLADPQALTPFLDAPTDGDLGGYLLGAAGAKPDWSAFFFYRHGRAFADNLRRSPATTRALEGLPLLRIGEHAPEVCFSVLSPGTHILPHHGVTNIRAVVHLPLVVPRECALRVGDEIHAWREGECVAFDDTWLHEAWNRSGDTRVILLMDAWNPHLTEPERTAVTTLIEGIGEFNRG